MKKVFSITALLAFGLVLAFTNCRKPANYDPCEGVVCDEGFVCVKGECIQKRK